MQFNAFQAWKHDEEIRKYFEAIFDMNVEPPAHTGFVCKCCREQFDCTESPVRLSGHALLHSERRDAPYSTARPLPITGEQVHQLYSMLKERFDAVTPEVGTWKFECKFCKNRLPHRTAVAGLMGHSEYCRESREMESESINQGVRFAVTFATLNRSSIKKPRSDLARKSIVGRNRGK